MALAVNADDHYRHHMPAGVVSRRMGFNKSTILDEMRALAEILRPCVRRLWRWLRESKVRHADETTWPCNGAHGQYAWGFFAKFVALFLFWKTRGGAVPGTVFAGVRDGVTVHDGYSAYDAPCEDASQQCYAHVMRRFGRLLKREPENKEYRAFVPKMCGLLAEVLAEALDLYAKTGSKAHVRDFLFPKHRPAKRPGRPVRGAEAGGDALGIQPAAHGAAASARAAG